MKFDNKVIERIVYNSIINNDTFRNNLIGSYFFPYKKYNIDVDIHHVIELKDNFDVRFKSNFYILDDQHSHEKLLTKYGSLMINKLIYTQYNSELKLQEMAITQEDKIRKALNEYLEFDSDELFKSKFNIVRVFGGAIRDIIADQPINDVDILCGSKAIKYIEMILEKNGYQYMEMLNGKDLQEMYSEIHVINEPHTWVKGKKIVQLIRPSNLFTKDGFSTSNDKWYHQGFSDLIANVDFSCCGVSYDGETLYEDFPNAILHCQSKVFSVNMRAKMYSQKRAQHRKVKLETRGWKEIKDSDSMNRDLKINVLGLDIKHESVYGC